MPGLTSGLPAVFMDRDGCLIRETGGTDRSGISAAIRVVFVR